MKESTKKWLVIAGLIVVCALLVFGISSVLYKEPQQVLTGEETTAEDVELSVESGDDTEKVSEETVKPEDDKELVIENETENTVESGEQNLQPSPEKTEDEKPQEPPMTKEDTDLKNPDAEPVYEPEEKAEEPATKKETAGHGDTKDGMIYIDGFGWIPDEGGGGSGTTANDMVENGNKVGIMD